ncbi:MAG: glycerophosphodiester phosphodiesterase family protein [Verrucomicrobiae bacterium]|nr:glycerophosphodiester phosphodiesterase family protein [Verrucomicrobiae bacterium]
MPILRIAHRGASSEAPENTLSAFKRAIEIGVDAIEMDVHLTRDGEVIVLHDETLDRTTNVKGPVAQLTLEEIRRADAGVRFAGKYRNEKVPTLAEALQLIPPPIMPMVEIKTAAAATATAKLIRDLGKIQQTTVISFFIEALQAVNNYDPRIRKGLLFGKNPVENDPKENVRQMLAMARTADTSTLDLNWPMATPQTVEEIHRANGTVWVWTVNEIDDMEKMIQTSVDGIASDNPARLNEAIGNLCRRSSV